MRETNLAIRHPDAAGRRIYLTKIRFFASLRMTGGKVKN